MCVLEHHSSLEVICEESHISFGFVDVYKLVVYGNERKINISGGGSIEIEQGFVFPFIH